jgi:DNA repair exonuclease SbcCD ATPase subunit
VRILKVRFKNLNSLLGEWELDLAVTELHSSGIFAICGPTGAGKSTLLDGICLALFGATPRLGRITKSSNDIMSKGTWECSAEVVFVAEKIEYRAVWSQRRARKSAAGELQNPQHEVALAGAGEILESGQQKVPQAIEQITGMNFERFTRSCLLAQGAFADFLRAAPSDRAPLLEQITGSEIYSRISVSVHERTALARKLRDETAAVLASMPVPESESSSQLSATLELLRQQHAEKVRASQLIQADIAKCTESTRVEQQIAANIVTIQSAQDRIRTCGPKYHGIKARCEELQLKVQRELAIRSQRVSLEQRRAVVEKTRVDVIARRNAVQRSVDALAKEIEADKKEGDKNQASIALLLQQQEQARLRGDHIISVSFSRIEFVMAAVQTVLRRKSLLAETHLSDGSHIAVVNETIATDEQSFISKARLALVPGDPCPVCLSRDHSLDKQVLVLDEELRGLCRTFVVTADGADGLGKGGYAVPDVSSPEYMAFWQAEVLGLKRRQREFETAEAKLASLRTDFDSKMNVAAVKVQRMDDLNVQLKGLSVELNQLELSIAAIENEREQMNLVSGGHIQLPELESLLQRAQSESEVLQKSLVSAELELAQRSDENDQLRLRAQQLLADLTRSLSFSSVSEILPHLNALLNESRAALDALQLDIARCEVRLGDLAERLLKYQSASQLLQRSSEQANRWQALHELIGSQDGKKYRNFVQSITLERLLRGANRYLRTMSDRYVFVSHPSHPLAIAIQDLYHGPIQRSVANLSGGETFLLSLALALGLAGLSSRRARVESLFVDEGFGSLDESSLDVAIDALSALNQAGKTIAVISHVLSLRERIPVRIEVTPGIGGRSALSGPGVSRI